MLSVSAAEVAQPRSVAAAPASQPAHAPEPEPILSHYRDHPANGAPLMRRRDDSATEACEHRHLDRPVASVTGDVQVDRLLIDERIAGDFLAPHHGAAPAAEPWPVMDIPAMAEDGEIPGVAPAVAARQASCRLDPAHQAAPEALTDEPFSDYNAVLPTDRLSFEEPGAPTDTPTPGLPHTVFTDTVEISWDEGGDWVRDILRERPAEPQAKRHKRGAARTSRTVCWAAAELWAEVQRWRASAAADMKAIAQNPAHRPATKTFIIPDRCHRGGGAYIWDLRPLLAAEAQGQPTDSIPIPHLDTSLPITPSLKADELRRRMDDAGIADAYGAQQLLELGVVSRSSAPRHTVLQFNYPAVARHASFARELARREATEGKLSEPFGNGFPFLPLRLNPYNAIEREDKDPRLCCDLSAPQAERDGGGSDSINAGMPLHDDVIIGRMRLTSAQAFVRDVGILLAARSDGAPPSWTGTADWKAFYRQFPKPIAELWGQVLWLDPAGPQIDWSVVFGDAAAPAQANRIQNILLELIACEFEQRMVAARASASSDAELQAWAAIDRWRDDRLAALRRRFPERWAELGPWSLDTHARLRIWRRRQQRLAVLHGFFDDSLLASFVLGRETKTAPVDGKPRQLTRATGPFELVIASLLDVADDIGLPVAAHKIECGTPEGERGRICMDQWRQHRQVWWALHEGSMVALGKELDLQRLVLRDTQDRVDGFLQTVQDLCAAANTNRRNDRPTVPISDLQTAIGRAFFILQSEHGLRSALNVPIRALAVVHAVAPALEARFRRTNPRVRRDRRGFPVHPPWRRCFFDTAAQTALLDMALGALPRAGTPFNPAVPSLGTTRRAVWLLQDASGSEGGGGGAVFLDPRDPGQARWSYDAFSATEAQRHSTYLEGLNANRNLRRAAAAGFQDILEVLDNAAWVYVARSGAASDPLLAELLTARASIRAEFPGVRVFSVWQCREDGVLADAVSKLELQYARYGPHQTQPATGRGWAHERLRHLGFPDGMADSQRDLPQQAL